MKKSILLISAVALIVAACKNAKFGGYDTTKNGLMYKIFKHGTGKKAMINDIVVFNNSTATMKDSLLAPAVSNAMTQVVKAQRKGDPNELFSMLSVGDSAAFLMAIDSVVSKGASLPKPFKHGDYFKVNITVKKVMSKDEYMANQKRVNDSIQELKAHEIVDYVSTNKLNAQKTASGIYYVIDNPGTGAQAANGKKVKVKYKGYLLNGTVFDPGAQPIDVVLGAHQVIPGWEEGIALFKKGGKGKLIIPSNLGYGERGAGGQIPPNATLVFDVEILDVN